MLLSGFKNIQWHVLSFLGHFMLFLWCHLNDITVGSVCLYGWEEVAQSPVQQGAREKGVEIAEVVQMLGTGIERYG